MLVRPHPMQRMEVKHRKGEWEMPPIHSSNGLLQEQVRRCPTWAFSSRPWSLCARRPRRSLLWPASRAAFLTLQGRISKWQVLFLLKVRMMGQRSSVYLQHCLSLLSSIDNSHIFPRLLFCQMKLQEKALLVTYLVLVTCLLRLFKALIWPQMIDSPLWWDTVTDWSTSLLRNLQSGEALTVVWLPTYENDWVMCSYYLEAYTWTVKRSKSQTDAVYVHVRWRQVLMCEPSLSFCLESWVVMKLVVKKWAWYNYKWLPAHAHMLAWFDP